MPARTMNERPGAAQPDSDARASQHALDLDSYIPAYFTYLAGKLSASASALYRPRFGVGITDWRITALVAADPWISAARICAETGLDKAAVSRSVRDLEKSGLIEVRPDPADQRPQVIALTRKGIALHDKIVKLAIAREQKRGGGGGGSERKMLLGFLIRLRAQVGAANLIDAV
jgi:DNA-binding MarR family transcriptional regulator